MKLKEIRAKKPAELEKYMVELKKELMQLESQVAMGTTPKSPRKIHAIKKTVARIKTIQNESKKSQS